MEPNERLELKILALKEELSSRDDRIADLRVMNHEIAQQLQSHQAEVASLRQQLEDNVPEAEGASASAEDSNDAN